MGLVGVGKEFIKGFWGVYRFSGRLEIRFGGFAVENVVLNRFVEWFGFRLIVFGVDVLDWLRFGYILSFWS